MSDDGDTQAHTRRTRDGAAADARAACAAPCSPRVGLLLAGALYLIAVRGEALLLDLAALRALCF